MLQVTDLKKYCFWESERGNLHHTINRNTLHFERGKRKKENLSRYFIIILQTAQNTYQKAELLKPLLIMNHKRQRYTQPKAMLRDTLSCAGASYLCNSEILKLFELCLYPEGLGMIYFFVDIPNVNHIYRSILQQTRVENDQYFTGKQLLAVLMITFFAKCAKSIL